MGGGGAGAGSPECAPPVIQGAPPHQKRPLLLPRPLSPPRPGVRPLTFLWKVPSRAATITVFPALAMDSLNSTMSGNWGGGGGGRAVSTPPPTSVEAESRATPTPRPGGGSVPAPTAHGLVHPQPPRLPPAFWTEWSAPVPGASDPTPGDAGPWRRPKAQATGLPALNPALAGCMCLVTVAMTSRL